MKLSLLIGDLDDPQIYGDVDVEIEGIAYDSRKCDKGFLFVALRGMNVDGHNFISAGIKRGANAVLCEEIPEGLEAEGITFVVVRDSRRALAEVSHRFYDYPTKGLNVIGITGTNGKTTTTYLIKSIYEEAGEKTALIGTTGIIIDDEFIPPTHTTPESLELCKLFVEMREKNVTTVIMEVSSHALAQSRVWGIDFDTAIFTNLTPDHLDYHEDMFEYATAKKQLFDMLKPESKAIVFNNSEFSEYVVRDCQAKVYFVGRDKGNDIRIKSEKMSLGHSAFELKGEINGNKIDLEFEISLSGKFNIENASLASVTALANNIDYETISKALAKASGAPGRMQAINLQSGALALVDYAHTPDALEKALQACRDILLENKNGGNLICVFGCGGDRDKTKRPIMGNISARIADYTVITSDNPRTEEPEKIIDEIYGGIDTGLKSKVVSISHRGEAIKYAVNFAKAGDILLVAGKGHEKYQIIGTERIHFDDAEEIKKNDMSI